MSFRRGAFFPRHRARWLVVLMAGFILLAQAATVHAAELNFPALTGRVVDQAGILTAAARAQIEDRLAAHESKTSDQIVVATVPSLQGDTIEDFANRLFRAWKLGQAKTNNGVLLLVAPKERKVRIEVGYGLEGTLTDALSRVIIAGAIAPKFKSGDFAGGITAGVEAITATLTGDDEWQKRAAEAPAAKQAPSIDPVTIILFLIVLFVVFRMMARMQAAGPGKAHYRRNGNWIVFPGGGSSSGSSWGSGSGWSSGSSGGFSGGGGSSGGGGASGDW